MSFHPFSHSHLGIFGLITLFDVLVHSCADLVFAYAVLRASRVIHRSLMESILGTTLRWLDVTPASRAIARFTADITAGTVLSLHARTLHPDPLFSVDGPILNVFFQFVLVTIIMTTSLGAVVFLTPLFLLPGIFAAVIGGFLGQVFLKVFLFDSPVLLRLLMFPLDTAVG
jgi:hypothetical protein